MKLLSLLSHAGCMNNLLFIQPARWSFRDCLQSRKNRQLTWLLLDSGIQNSILEGWVKIPVVIY